MTGNAASTAQQWWPATAASDATVPMSSFAQGEDGQQVATLGEVTGIPARGKGRRLTALLGPFLAACGPACPAAVVSPDSQASPGRTTQPERGVQELLARRSGPMLVPGGWDHDHRADRVQHHRMADRPEQQLAEAPTAP
jgi:hypothetical protein